MSKCNIIREPGLPYRTTLALAFIPTSQDWVISETYSKNEYYVLISYNPEEVGAKEKAKAGQITKDSRIFIYDRKNRIAAYIEY